MALSPQEKESLRKGLDMVRANNIKMVRANPRSMAKYVDKTFAEMKQDVRAHCCGTCRLRY